MSWSSFIGAIAITAFLGLIIEVIRIIFVSAPPFIWIDILIFMFLVGFATFMDELLKRRTSFKERTQEQENRIQELEERVNELEGSKEKNED
ncbi:MAG: hypothetical protein PVH12_07910 [Candidatus Bathyarchaeota archaeon]|jgi:hypothetical protein